jgi:hypothetical protein
MDYNFLQSMYEPVVHTLLQKTTSVCDCLLSGLANVHLIQFHVGRKSLLHAVIIRDFGNDVVVGSQI